MKVKHNSWSSNHQVSRKGHDYEGETQFIKSQVKSGWWVLDIARLVNRQPRSSYEGETQVMIIKPQGEKSYCLILHISRQVSRDGHNYEGETQFTKPKVKIRCTAHVVLCRCICCFPGRKRTGKMMLSNREESNVLLPFHDNMIVYSVAVRWGGGLLKRKRILKKKSAVKKECWRKSSDVFYFVCHNWFATCPQLTVQKMSLPTAN